MFLSDEIDFIYGKFLHSESPNYTAVERRGRGRPLGPVQRSLVLSIYNELVDGLAKVKHFDAREMPRAAAVMLLKGEAPEYNYTDILVDEVQDLSDIELRVLHAIECFGSRVHPSEELQKYNRDYESCGKASTSGGYWPL